MKKRIKFLSMLVSLVLLLSVFLTVFGLDTRISAEQSQTDYVVKEDAFVRNGNNANKNYNYEDITNAHGSQYAGKGLRVINTKYNGSDEIISIMKFDLPTLDDIKKNSFDTFEFQFDVFKNLNYKNGNQGYIAHYTTDNNWNETSISWNNKPAAISRDNTNQLFSFYIDQNDEYEIKDDTQKHIKRDITSTILKLVEEHHSEITIFITAKYSLNTGLMIHSKESSATTKQAKITASNKDIKLTQLEELIQKTSTLSSNYYTEGSYSLMQNNLAVAKNVVDNDANNITKIKDAYHELLCAYEALEKSYINVSDVMEERMYTNENGDSMPYRLYVPQDYDATKKYPVVVFLHGAGERGDDNKAQLKNAIQTLFNTQEEIANAIVIAPQCPKDKRWVETDWKLGNYDSESITEIQLKSVMSILKNTQNEFSTDIDRVYAYGLSMGGFGTWDLITRHSDVFAAAVAICGGGDVNKADILKDIPIWTFHGTKDNVVPYSGTEALYNAIKTAGGDKITFTTYEGADHIIWEKASSQPFLLQWLFSQKLSDRSIARTSLSALLDQTKQLVEEEYTPNSWNILRDNIDKANVTLLDLTLTEQDVQQVLSNLQQSIDTLLKRADTNELDKIVKQYDALDKSVYTVDSWNAFEKILINAKSTLIDKNTTQTNVDKIIDTLKLAYDKLVKIKPNVNPVINKPNKDTVSTGDNHDMQLLYAITLLSFISFIYFVKKHSSKI